VVWTATVVSNIGGWMQSAAAGWLMTTLDTDPRTVAMVQVATMLPMFLLGLPAGALADILDRRRLLLVVETIQMCLIGALAWLVALHRVTAVDLLVFTLMQGVTSALVSPAWQAIVPQLVGPEDLSPAVALNSAGINVSRFSRPTALNSPKRPKRSNRCNAGSFRMDGTAIFQPSPPIQRVWPVARHPARCSMCWPRTSHGFWVVLRISARPTRPH
jgi:hypothetical protein